MYSLWLTDLKRVFFSFSEGKNPFLFHMNFGGENVNGNFFLARNNFISMEDSLTMEYIVNGYACIFQGFRSLEIYKHI